MPNDTYAPKLPLDISDNDFVYISDALENARQNIKMIILTNPGEKIMDPEYGVGIKKYIFEPTGGLLEVTKNQFGDKSFALNNMKEEILVNITKQVDKYNPEIIIRNIELALEENIAFLSIFYNYRGFVEDILEIPIGV